jgi:hypothetical protein
VVLSVSCDAARWRSYFTSGSSAIYLFLYSAFYFYTKLDITKARQLCSLYSESPTAGPSHAIGLMAAPSLGM